jgi:hypothetical protein
LELATMTRPLQARFEVVAAVVNGLLVVLVPLAVLVAAGSIDLDSSDASVTARDPEPSRSWSLMPILIRTTFVLLPFAGLAGWRTWVYARRWCDRTDRGWRAVAEAGACGLSLALLYLGPGIVTRPADAPPYVIAYGGAALVLGVLMGLFLRSTAILVLKLSK